VNLHDVQPVKQIVAERAPLDSILQVGICQRD
jgi:hypothetical protein